MPLSREDLVVELQLDLEAQRAKGDQASVVRTTAALNRLGVNSSEFDRLVDPRVDAISAPRTRHGFVKSPGL